MMVGTLLLNFWAALAAFTIYFLTMFQKPETPFNILMGSFIFAFIGFVITFIIRYLIGYIFYTPEDLVEKTIEEDDNANSQVASQTRANSSSFEVNDESSSEEIAQVVRTMMNS